MAYYLGHFNHCARSRAMVNAREYPGYPGRPTIPIPSQSAEASHGNLLSPHENHTPSAAPADPTNTLKLSTSFAPPTPVTLWREALSAT